MFKLKINLDRHCPRPLSYIWLLPDQHCFSFPPTFNFALPIWMSMNKLEISGTVPLHLLPKGHLNASYNSLQCNSPRQHFFYCSWAKYFCTEWSSLKSICFKGRVPRAFHSQSRGGALRKSRCDSIKKFCFYLFRRNIRIMRWPLLWKTRYKFYKS